MSSGLQDILPPPHVAGGAGVITVISVLALLLLSVAVLRYYRAPRNRSRRALNRLHSRLDRGQVDTRTVAHELAASLHQALDNRALTHATTAEWDDFSHRLNAARFSRHPCSQELVQALLQEARFWLEHSQ